MLFKNPNLLYGLLFLLIPIIVHLFQLRKFKKVPFSNVAFLKPLINQTSKSRTLKKWLTLLARMLAVACIVIAFAQPYFAVEKNGSLDDNLVVYLDNSYSMQAKGADGKLYQTTVNDLIEKLPSQLRFSLFTNSKSFKNITKQEIANELLTALLSSNQLTPDEVLLKANSFKIAKNSSSSLLWISDFQNIRTTEFPKDVENWNLRIVKAVPRNSNNVSVDSAFVAQDDNGNYKITSLLSSSEQVDQPVTVSLYNKNVLLAKTAASFENNQARAEFSVPSISAFDGFIQIEDNGLQFDNQLFLSTNDREKIKLLHINDTDADFLRRIYTADEFEYTTSGSNNLNYNSIKEQEVIILNEVSNIVPSLATELNTFTKQGKTLVIIPATAGANYGALDGLSDVTTSTVEKRITKINFDHPVLKNVFSKRVTNFQYPKAAQITKGNTGGNVVLSYDDGSPFLSQIGTTYVFTAALNEQNSNFQNSPLVVPVFYKMGLNNTASSTLYYELGIANDIVVSQQMAADDILELQLKEEQRWIPEQRAFNSFVTLTTNNELTQAGNYRVLLKNQEVGKLSFNASRDENKETYYTNDELGANVLNSVSDFTAELQEASDRVELWKWFIAGVLFFLICELLILKFLK